MTVKNPTTWSPPNRWGYPDESSGTTLETQSGVTLITQSEEELIINDSVVTNNPVTSWDVSSRTDTEWQDETVVYVGAQNLTDNLGNYLVTNDGDNLVTTDNYNVPKTPTEWTASGT